MRSLKRAFNTRKVLALALIVLMMNPHQVYASDGDLDPTFGLGGKVTTDFPGSQAYANVIAIQPDGKIVAAGEAGGREGVFALARYNKDGSLDTTFGTGGRVTTNFGTFRFQNVVTALAIQPDGKIVAAGQSWDDCVFCYYYDNGLMARYNSDGSLDTTFGIGGMRIDDFYYAAIAVQSDGKIITAGLASRFRDFAVARYNSDGSLDPSFGLNGLVTTTFFTDVNEAFALAIQPDGKIVAAGQTGSYSTYDFHFALARYHSDGSLDPAFGVAGKVTTDFSPRMDYAVAVAIQSDGKILAAGRAGMYFGLNYDSDFALARYNNDGSLDPTFALGGKVTTDFSRNDRLSDLAVQFDGKIVAAGESSGDFALVRYNSDGSQDDAFGVGGKVTTDFSGLTDVAAAIAIQSDGKIVTAGGSGFNFALARYQSTPPPVTSLTFDPTIVRPGETLTAIFSGTNLTEETYFDIRFRSPGSSTDQVALNWQRGASGRRTVPIGTALGTWTVNGVRAHRDANDHAADFVSIVSTLTVTQVRLSLNLTRYCTGASWDLRVTSRASNASIEPFGKLQWGAVGSSGLAAHRKRRQPH